MDSIRNDMTERGGGWIASGTTCLRGDEDG